MRFVMNEKAYAEEILANPQYKKIDGQTVTILAKYFRAEGLGDTKIKAALEKFVGERDPIMLAKTRTGLINKSVRLSKKPPLYDIKIVISKPEMEIIN